MSVGPEGRDDRGHRGDACRHALDFDAADELADFLFPDGGAITLGLSEQARGGRPAQVGSRGVEVHAVPREVDAAVAGPARMATILADLADQLGAEALEALRGQAVHEVQLAGRERRQDPVMTQRVVFKGRNTPVLDLAGVIVVEFLEEVGPMGLGLGLSVGKGGALFLKLGRERLDHVLPPRRGGRTGDLPDDAGDLFAGMKHWED